jgi:hypothetical protein
VSFDPHEDTVNDRHLPEINKVKLTFIKKISSSETSKLITQGQEV